MKRLKHLKQYIFLAITLVFLMIPDTAWARGEAIEKLKTGSLNLMNDAYAALMVIIPTSAGLVAGYSAFRRKMADEQEKKIWNDRIKTAFIFAVIGMLSMTIVKTILAYFK